MTALTLPGTLPGLLRRGSPVVVSGPEAGGWHYPAIVVVFDPSRRAIQTRSPIHAWASGVHMPRNVAMDLEDPTGRAHATWWLAAQFFRVADPASWAWRHFDGERIWGVINVSDHLGDCHTFQPYEADRVEALAELDPTDPRLLPDGSRWVDAEALRLVCLEVAS